MLKANVKARYETEKYAATGGATVHFNAGDFKIRASMTDATVINRDGLALAVEKPGSFIFEYDVPNQVPLNLFSSFLFYIFFVLNLSRS